MYIVLSPSQSERGSSKDVKTLKSKEELTAWIMSTRQDIQRLEIYEAKRLNINVEFI